MDRRHHLHSAGSAVVEFALLLPILMLLLAGIFGLGRGLAQYETLTKATRDGARLFSVAPKATISSLGVQAAKDRVVEMAQKGGMPGFASSYVVVSCWKKATYVAESCADGTEPGAVTVTVDRWPYVIGSVVPFIRLNSNLTTRSITMTATTTMRYMNPN